MIRLQPAHNARSAHRAYRALLFYLDFARYKLFPFSFCLILFSSCASLRYPSTYQMTAETIRSSDGSLSVKVPMGWFNSTDPNVAPGLLIWLVKKDYTAAITLTELHTDMIGSKQMTNDGLESLASISYSLKKERVQQPLQRVAPNEIFSVQGRKFCSYEYSTDRGKTVERVIVFNVLGRWYELSAVPFQKRGRYIDHESIFSVQNSVLITLSY